MKQRFALSTALLATLLGGVMALPGCGDDGATRTSAVAAGHSTVRHRLGIQRSRIAAYRDRIGFERARMEVHRERIVSRRARPVL
jgi:hypothetical protein